MIVTVFRSRIRPQIDTAAMEGMGARMFELASAMPGFVAYKDFVADDGEFVSIVEFETLEHVAAWRDHPEHRVARDRGRDQFFADYHIQVCETVRDYTWQRLPS